MEKDKDWIKTGNTVYVVSSRNSGNATIEKVGKKYFYLKGLYRVKVDINTLYGSYPGYGNVYKIYPSKEAYEEEKELKRKRTIISQNTNIMTDEEVLEIYNKIIQRDRK